MFSRYKSIAHEMQLYMERASEHQRERERELKRNSQLGQLVNISYKRILIKLIKTTVLNIVSVIGAEGVFSSHQNSIKAAEVVALA